MAGNMFTNEEIDAAFAEDEAIRADAFKQSISAASDTNPDQYAEAVKTSRQVGVPPEFVAQDLDFYKRETLFKPETVTEMVKNYPKFIEWADNLDNARLIHDDIPATTYALDKVRSFGASLIDDFAGRSVQGVGGMAQSFAELAAQGEVKRQDVLNKSPYSVSSLMSSAAIGLTSIVGDTLDLSGSGLRKAGEFIAPPLERRDTVDSFIRGVGQGGASIATAYASPVFSALSQLAQGASITMDEADKARADGKQVDPGKEAVGVLTGGLITAGTELPVLDAILKRFPAADAIFKAVPDKFKTDAVEFVGKMTLAATAEGLQEAAEGFLQRINTQTFINKDREDYSLKEATGDATIGGAVGATMQGLVYLALHIKNRNIPDAIKESYNAAKAKLDIKGMVDAVKATKLQTRDPEKMRELLKSENLDDKRIVLDGGVIKQFNQSGLDPEEFFGLAPAAREQFEQSLLSGTDISIPLDQYIHALSTGTGYDFMTDFVKVDVNVNPEYQGFDIDNPEERDAFIQSAIRQAKSEWNDQYTAEQELGLEQRIERQIRDNLVNKELMGEKVMSPEVAADVAATYAAYARTAIARGGDAASRVISRRLENGAFQVQGFAPKLPSRVGSGSAFYDRLAKKAKGERLRKEKSDAKKAGKKDLFGAVPETKKSAARPTPVINALIDRGGIQRGSIIEKELSAIGITPKAYPRLFRKGAGLRDIDNLPITEMNASIQNANFKDDGNGYVDRNDLLEKLRDETFGNYIRSDAQLAAETLSEQDQYILDLLKKEGVDIETATAEEIDAAIKRVNEEANATADADGVTYNQDGVVKTETAAFKKWFGDSKVVDENGDPLVVYHGTVTDFESFDMSRANPESDMGAGIYFTNNAREVSENYAGTGPDMTQKIIRRAEQIQNESDDEISYDDALVTARDEFVQHEGAALPVYVSIKNPVYIGGDNETFLDYTESYDEETDEYGEPEGSLVDFIESLQSIADEFQDVDPQQVAGHLYENANGEGIKVSDLIHLLKDRDTGMQYATNDNGDLVVSEVIRRAFEGAGFDGVIDQSVNQKFGSERRVGKKMVGMDEGTVHYIAFRPEQIKSVFNSGTFDANDPRILFQEERANIVFGQDGKTLINLFEKSDETAIFHEGGHLFLDITAEIAAQPDATPEFKKEFEKTLEWLGVDSYSKVTTKEHEKFARGFEAYLYNGEAPSVELKGMFTKFKLWFTRVYKSIRDLNVPVSQKMRDIFDRMLATDEEINSLRTNKVFNVDNATLEMLNAEQKKRYLKAKQDEENEAKDKLLRKAYRQMRRQKTEFWETESAKVKAEVEQELQKRPVYAAIQFLQFGENFNGEPIATDDAGNKLSVDPKEHKLNESAVVALFDAFSGTAKVGKEELKYLPRGVRSSDGAIDPKFLADMFGFTSPIDMLRQMQKADPYKIAVQKMTEDRMIAKYGDMLRDGTIEEEAIAVYMAESTKSSIIALKALGEKTGIEYPSDGDFEKAAKIALGALTVDQAIKPEKYYRASLKAAQEYGKALGKKDYVAAAEAKRREILNKHFHKLSKKAKDEIGKALDRFKTLEKMPPKGKAAAVKIDPVYHQKIWELLDKYNFTPRLSADKRLRLELASLNDWIRKLEIDDNAVLQVPPEIMNADSKTHYRDLTMDEFRGVRDLIINIETQGRAKREYVLDGKKQDLENTVFELVSTAETYNKAIPVSVSERQDDRTVKAWMKGVVNGVDAVNTKIAQVAARLDGGDNFGLWTRYVYEPIQRAEINRNVRARAEYTKLNDIMTAYYPDGGAELSDVFTVGAEQMSRESLISLAMHYTATQDNRQKIIDGYASARGWDQAMIERALGNMREKDWQFVMAIRDYLDSFWVETSAVETRRFGFPPEKLEGLPPEEWNTADGKKIIVRGGYMRIKYDGAQDAVASQNELKENFEDFLSGKSTRATTKRGSQIERVSGVRRPIRLDFDVISEHVSEQVGIITMAEPVENVAKILRHEAVQQTLQNLLGREQKQMMDLWLQDVAAGGQLSGGRVNSLLRMIRRNYTIGRLGLRPITAVLQFSGLSHTIADPDLGIKQTAIGLSKYMSRGNPQIIINEIAQKSSFMRERRFTLNRDVADAITAYTTKAKNIESKAAALMLYPMQKAQEQVDTITWLAAYDRAIRLDGKEEADAIRYADLAVARLQASGLASDLAPIERGTLNSTSQRQEYVKAGTMFFSYFNAKYNIIKNVNTKFQNKQISAVDAAGSYVMALLVEGLISSFIMGQIDWEFDDDDDVSVSEMVLGGLGAAMFNLASTIPFVRTISGGAQGFGGETAAEGQLAGLGVLANRLYKTGEKLLDGESEDINGYALTRNIVDAVNVVAPVPASMINQFIRGLEKQENSGDAEIQDYLIYRKSSD